MKVKELIERFAVNDTGRITAYIKDGLEEINLLAETHVDTERINLEANRRFYELPNNMLKIIIAKAVAKHGLIPLLIKVGDMAVKVTKTKKDDEAWAKVKKVLESL